MRRKPDYTADFSQRRQGDRKGRKELLGTFQAASFAAVGAQEQKRKDQAAEAEPGEHNLAGGVAMRGVAEGAVGVGEGAEAQVLDGSHEAEGGADAAGVHDERHGW